MGSCGELMASQRQWEFASRFDAERLQDALDEAEGLPRKGTPVTGGVHGPIPDVWSEGAPGWSSHVSEVEAHPSAPNRFAIRCNDDAMRYAGRRVASRKHGNVVVPTLAQSVVRGQDWDARRARRR